MHETEFIECLVRFLFNGPFSEVVMPNRNYLELGINRALQFNRVAPLCDRAVAVDCVDYSENIKLNDNDYLGFWMSTYEFITNELPRLGVEFGLVFIDADHSHYHSLIDFLGVLPYVSDGGYVILHDTCPPSVEEVLNGVCGTAYLTAVFIKERMPELEIVTLSPGYGVTIIRKSTNHTVWQKDGDPK